MIIKGFMWDHGKENGNQFRPLINKPLSLIGVIIGILILRPLKGGGLLIMGLHYLNNFQLRPEVAVHECLPCQGTTEQTGFRVLGRKGPL